MVPGNNLREQPEAKSTEVPISETAVENKSELFQRAVLQKQVNSLLQVIPAVTL